MSEWKWCQTCQHRYDRHGPGADDMGRWINGPCHDCDCQWADLDLADLW